ncbi:MAG: hypothetical protein ACLTV6_06260 [Christensenellales bacterium]
MDLRPVGVNGILAVLGDSISEQTGAQVAALREAIATRISAAWKKPSPLMLRCSSNMIRF